jgi:3-methyladenine DNA glycosylase AlkD
MESAEVLRTLQALGSRTARDSMRRFGISSDNAHGVTTPQLKSLARRLGKSHDLAAELWDSGVFEARAVAALIDEPAKVSRAQMERWARAFDSWAICDGCCCYLFRRTPFAWEKARVWSGRKAEFVKRAGFALMAYLAVHDKQTADAAFEEFFPLMIREADDDRLYVRKAINWALRQIGKRSKYLHPRAVKTAEVIRKRNTPSGRWIAADALRELRSERVRAKLRLR